MIGQFFTSRSNRRVHAELQEDYVEAQERLNLAIPMAELDGMTKAPSLSKDDLDKLSALLANVQIFAADKPGQRSEALRCINDITLMSTGRQLGRDILEANARGPRVSRALDFTFIGRLLSRGYGLPNAPSPQAERIRQEARIAQRARVVQQPRRRPQVVFARVAPAN